MEIARTYTDSSPGRVLPTAKRPLGTRIVALLLFVVGIAVAGSFLLHGSGKPRRLIPNRQISTSDVRGWDASLSHGQFRNTASTLRETTAHAVFIGRGTASDSTPTVEISLIQDVPMLPYLVDRSEISKGSFVTNDDVVNNVSFKDAACGSLVYVFVHLIGSPDDLIDVVNHLRCTDSGIFIDGVHFQRIVSERLIPEWMCVFQFTGSDEFSTFAEIDAREAASTPSRWWKVASNYVDAGSGRGFYVPLHQLGQVATGRAIFELDGQTITVHTTLTLSISSMIALFNNLSVVSMQEWWSGVQG